MRAGQGCFFFLPDIVVLRPNLGQARGVQSGGQCKRYMLSTDGNIVVHRPFSRLAIAFLAY